MFGSWSISAHLNAAMTDKTSAGVSEVGSPTNAPEAARRDDPGVVADADFAPPVLLPRQPARDEHVRPEALDGK